MSTVTQTAYTVGELADRFNVPRHRILYAVLAKGIKATSRASGTWRLFDEQAAAEIEQALAETAANGRRMKD
jgi:DNA-binding transcriptional MerR regulator